MCYHDVQTKVDSDNNVMKAVIVAAKCDRPTDVKRNEKPLSFIIGTDAAA